MQSLMSLQYSGTKVPVSSPDVYYYYYLPTYGNNLKTYFPNQENYQKLLCKIHDSKMGYPSRVNGKFCVNAVVCEQNFIHIL